MTFFDIVSDIQDRLNLSDSDSLKRIGRGVNRRYRSVTSSIGLQTSRRMTVQADATLGVSTLTFSGEKLINVVDRSVTPYKVLEEVTVDELEDNEGLSLTTPSQFAVLSVIASSITIKMNCVPQTAFTLYADVQSNASTLSALEEPAFPESFHDILLWGVLADEYRKLMQPALAKDAEMQYAQRLSDLRMWLAVSGQKEIYQGKVLTKTTSGGSSGSGSGVSGSSSYTQTGLVTFDRVGAPGSAPFAVASGSSKVANLDADTLDGLDSTDFATSTDLADYTLLSTFNLHHSRHESGEADAIKLDDLASPDDNTDLNASVGKHGLLRKLSGTATEFLDGTGAFDSIAQGDLPTTSAKLASANTGGDLLFTDATFDIGKSGATRPRDGFFSRNVAVGGTLAVTGVATLTAKPIISAGLQFPATQVPDADANTLDDYEENIWIPILGGSGGTSGQTYSVQNGRVLKVGKLVTCWGQITLTAKGIITAGLQIQALPYTSATQPQHGAIVFTFFQNLNVAYVWLTGFVVSNSTAANIYGLTAAGVTTTALATADVANNSAMSFMITYEAAS